MPLDRLSSFLRSKGARVSYIVMPDLPDGAKCGLDDWFANGRNRDELARLNVAELPPLTTLSSPSTTPTAASDDSANIPRIISRSMDQIETKHIEWLWPGRLPKGMLALLGGYAGDGKSTLTAALAAALSTGGTLPDGTKAPVTNCLMLCAENDISRAITPRLRLHQTDTRRTRITLKIWQGRREQLFPGQGIPCSFLPSADLFDRCATFLVHEPPGYQCVLCSPAVIPRIIRTNRQNTRRHGDFDGVKP